MKSTFIKHVPYVQLTTIEVSVLPSMSASSHSCPHISVHLSLFQPTPVTKHKGNVCVSVCLLSHALLYQNR